MKISIVIPTYQRIEKLKRLLNSIKESKTQHSYTITIIADNNDISTKKAFPEYEVWINDKQEFVIGSWNKFFKNEFYRDWDAVLWLVDDTEIYPDLIEKAANKMLEKFSDLDGIIGLAQECPGHPEYTYKEYGQLLIGKKFVERYQRVGYTVSCPDYFHFYQDEELWMYASSLNKFYFCKEAILKHYHPAFIKDEIDTTHPIVRNKIIREDKNTYLIRRTKKLIWGHTWELVNK